MVSAIDMPQTMPQQLPPQTDQPADETEAVKVMIDVRDLDFAYGSHQVLHKVALEMPARAVTAFIGPSGCGKTTLLRCINRMNELIPGVRVEGGVLFHGENVYAPRADAVEVRRRIGMVFQKPNPFPKSIFENIAFGRGCNGFKGDLNALVPEVRAGRVQPSTEALARWLWERLEPRIPGSARLARVRVAEGPELAAESPAP